MAEFSKNFASGEIKMRVYSYKPLPADPEATKKTKKGGISFPPIRLFILPAGPPEDSLSGKIAFRRTKPKINQSRQENDYEQMDRGQDDVPAHNFSENTDPKSEDEEYEALSYFWGNEKQKVNISIQVKDEVYALSVSPNLAAALKHLRLPHKARRLWVDAICINQDNSTEKSQQISIMDQIYGDAKNVCVWLGNETEKSHFVGSSSSAFDLIEKMLDFRQLDNLVDESRTHQWAALGELMTRPWFSRRWIVQEIAYAKQATVHCGRREMKWPDLADAVALFASKSGKIAELFKQNSKYNNQHDYLGKIEVLGAHRLVLTVSKLFRKSDDGQKRDKLMSLESLVSNLSAFKAQHPHDIIYAILSLASDTLTTASARPDLKRKASSLEETIDHNIQPTGSETAWKYGNRFLHIVREQREKKLFSIDYKKRFFEVCKDFIDFSIKNSGSLDIICRPWAPDRMELPLSQQGDELPSWICRLSKSPFREDNDGRYQRINADLLVGTPDLGRRTYSAAASVPLAFHFDDPKQSPKSMNLYCTGMILTYIEGIRGTALEGAVPPDWLEFGGWLDVTEDPPESFWRTLVADRDAYGYNPPTYYARACKHIFSQRVSGGALSTQKLKMKETTDVVQEYLNRLEAVLWRRKLMKTKLGHLGLVPDDAEKGDMIGILNGCSVPVVLRLLDKSQSSMLSHVPTRESVAPDDSAEVPQTSQGQSGRGDGASNAAAPSGSFLRRIPCQLIGECYVHGMMDGSAFNHLDEKMGRVEFRIS